ncbi:protein gp37 [Kaistia soli DSM 19436]|uniref:Protein gp37 n=1 Tax=Kaistia soli DSM 19436 TaxID=1122133 RepID=A0A1M4Y5H5_9HYPH|nr:phage Gp37/Gp68 family protein [Kaistia soli]SHF00929.1 protein gp37 [Kaistia soli DSM 19436]
MSKIEWTEATWNPIVGCSIVSPGCTHCYAMRMAARIEAMGNTAHYDGTTQSSKAGAVWTGKVALAPDHILIEPLHRKKPTTYFVNSMGDLFHESVPDEWVDRIFAIMALAPQHTFQVLTKRSARMRAYFASDVGGLGRRVGIDLASANMVMEGVIPPCRAIRLPLPNVWLGISAEDQRRADERVPDLLATPAAVRFVSAEPLLGGIDFTSIPDGVVDGIPIAFNALSSVYDVAPHIDWIIVGGESGPGARPTHPDWARSIRDQCAAADVPFFFKQWGEFRIVPAKDGSETWPAPWFGSTPPRSGDLARMTRVGKKRAGRLLDGIEHNAMPKMMVAA